MGHSLNALDFYIDVIIQESTFIFWLGLYLFIYFLNKCIKM